MLPNVIFKYGKSGMGGVNPTSDGVCGLIIQVPEAPTGLDLGKVATFYALTDAEAVGLNAKFDEENGCFAYAEISDFFGNMNGKGELWVLLVSNTTSMADICDKTKDIAAKLLRESEGRICMWGIAANRSAEYHQTTVDGLDEDVWAAMENAQSLNQQFALELYSPSRTIIPGRGFSGTLATLKDLTTASATTVQITLHGRKDSLESRVGFLLGWKAIQPVQRNAGRVATGNLKVPEAYLTDGSTKAEDLFAVQDVLNDKGYLFPIVRLRKSGYFYNDDFTAASRTDDFSSFPNGRVMDKVERIAYDVYLEYINDDFILSQDGRIGPDALKNLQGDIKEAVDAVMVSNGELSNFQAYVDPAQDAIATGKVVVELRAQPKGYYKVIEVTLGFTKSLTQ